MHLLIIIITILVIIFILFYNSKYYYTHVLSSYPESVNLSTLYNDFKHINCYYDRECRNNTSKKCGWKNGQCTHHGLCCDSFMFYDSV